jgi:hypothetical protein
VLAIRSGYRSLHPFAIFPCARPSSLRTLRELLGSLLHGGADGGEFSGGCTEARDEIQNLFEEDGPIEIAVEHAKVAEFGVRVVVWRVRSMSAY